MYDINTEYLIVGMVYCFGDCFGWITETKRKDWESSNEREGNLRSPEKNIGFDGIENAV